MADRRGRGPRGRRDEIEDLFEGFPDLPREAILKEDILRTGLGFSEEALRLASGAKSKSYFLSSFDRVSLEEMGRAEDRRAPEEVALSRGPYDLRRTIVSTRINPGSPYQVDARDDLLLTLEGEPIAHVSYPEIPEYYRRRLSGGLSLPEVAPTIEWGYLVYLTVYRKCQYMALGEGCLFCDINGNLRAQVRAGRPYRTVKEVEDVVEAMGIIAEADVVSRVYTLTGGSIATRLRGLDEVGFYSRYARAIESRHPGRWIGKVVAQAATREDLGRFHDAGIRIYHPNLEVWDPRLFAAICPGKARQIGRDEWIRRTIDAAEVFGPAHVIPNLVAGVELSRPHGFRRVEDALRSTGEGIEFFMSHGISPRFTTWCPEPLSPLGREEPAPLGYHVGLLRIWRDTHRRHRLPVPPGYGEPGPGRAVFSVSAFMDVIDGGTGGETPLPG